MAGKVVSFEYVDKKQLSDITVMTRLSDAFLLAVSRADDAVFTAKKDTFTFTVGYDSFLRLMDQLVFYPSMVEAFAKADARMKEFDAQRSTFGARLVDAFRNHSRMTAGLPLAVFEEKIDLVDDLKVSIKRYGLAQAPK